MYYNKTHHQSWFRWQCHRACLTVGSQCFVSHRRSQGRGSLAICSYLRLGESHLSRCAAANASSFPKIRLILYPIRKPPEI